MRENPSNLLQLYIYIFLLSQIAKNRDKQQTAERAIEKLSQQLDSDALAWWSHLLFEHLNGVQQKKLIERIGADLGTAMPGSERH